MRERILHKAAELFIALGVKSVTMDDLAQDLCMSKKTIYESFKNKYELIKATSEFVFENIKDRIDKLTENSEDSPIATLFKINLLVFEHFHDNKNIEYQLSKYYPEIYQNLFDKKFDIVINGITLNINRGKNMGLYRTNVNTDESPLNSQNAALERGSEALGYEGVHVICQT